MDVQKLLNQFLGAGGRSGLGSGHGQGGFGQTGGNYGAPSSGGSVVDQLGSLLGGKRGGSGGGSGINSAIAGALASGLASQLFRGKSMGKMGGSALKLGGAALVAGIAYKAYQSWQANQQNQRPGQGFLPQGGAAAGSIALDNGATLPQAHGTPFLPGGQEEAHASLMLSAMIAAAKADGYIDADEERAIFGRIDEIGLDAEEQGFLAEQMRRPMSISELAARATSPEIAVEVYTASLIAIDPDHPAEQAYLKRLADALRLAPDLVAQIHRTTGDVIA
ncbi:tellurite resistance TerB family protein [Antarcticirhabdus aurantiaca]|uniref:Tellurite resistance TerB family protein n=1 Tax=Antarcticirhabdus aurantiaca TaxID=2606717 RepID=A0ACD4NS85_9HYPH|nr:tellurite resistance TerB family protein [Antarcticirhabdus aurantiaca]WAJ29613.1 tellurite resistance TerB family protein [Jeongeuplla avenae]